MRMKVPSNVIETKVVFASPFWEVHYLRTSVTGKMVRDKLNYISSEEKAKEISDNIKKNGININE
jgi:hypothetical protein